SRSERSGASPCNRSRSTRSSGAGTPRPSTRSEPSATTATSIGFMSFGLGSGLVTLGSSIWAPSVSAGATTMKMMSSTKTTSTSGVTLISGAPASESSRLPFPLLRSVTPMMILHLVQELAHGAPERELDARNPRAQVVEEDHGRDGDHEAEGRLHERLGDTGRNRRNAPGAGRADPLERADDADHRSEQPDERRDRAHGREHVEPAPELGRELLLLALGLVARELDGGEAPLRLLGRAQVPPHDRGEQRGERRVLELIAGFGELLELPLVDERRRHRHEALRLAPGAV